MFTSSGRAFVTSVISSTSCLLHNESTSYFYKARLSRNDGAEAKASLKRAIKFYGVDPKPSDLSMDRMKPR